MAGRTLTEGRAIGTLAFGTPGKGDIVSLRGVEGVVLKRSQDGSCVWVEFPGDVPRMFTYRNNLVPFVGREGVPSAFREFPEQMGDPSLTIGRNGW